ncbi:hypothetical protein B0O99DRAFT_610582 [Bisporella sp. PMI_857]|nr:hypothetical protein B0O99DRAFT_610582 [Bisporella sp. PMI_857]
MQLPFPPLVLCAPRCHSYILIYPPFHSFFIRPTSCLQPTTPPRSIFRLVMEQVPSLIPAPLDAPKAHWFIGSIDCGTTSSRFLIFDGTGTPVAGHQIEFENLYPESGWHEHNPQELVDSVNECIDKATEEFLKLGHKKTDIKAIGITNQRETTICWDTNTGEPLYNAIVWPDTRTTALVRELKKREGSEELQQLCGLPLSTYPSSVKFLWMYENVESVKKAYDESRLSFGTVDTWLVYKLNGGKEANIHVTDATNASRTMFMNLHTLQYDDKLLDFFKLDQKNITLPKIVPSSDKDAYGKLSSGALEGIKITGCLGDQSSALVGQCGFEPGQAKTHMAQDAFYCIIIAVAGSGVKFLINNLGFLQESAKITELAETVTDNGGVVFVTAFSGLFAPYWIDDAKGTLFGITQHTQRGHIARATLEATCYQTKAILDAMEKDSGHKLESLAVDGGMSNSDLTMQTQADITGIQVDRPAMRETTALGAAIAAGFAVDIWKEFAELKEINVNDRKIFKPAMDPKISAAMFKKWEQAVEMSRGWVLQNSESDE